MFDIPQQTGALQGAQFRQNKAKFSNATGIELMFLGTSAGSPSNSRNVTSMVLRLAGVNCIFC